MEINFTKYEQSVIEELEKRAGDVLYFKDIASFFISKSYLELSTYTQTAYIRVGDNIQNALSEHFQAVVFLKKLEKNGFCFSIPYTPLEDNSVSIGNSEFAEYQQHTIADGDLLIQLFHFGAKKYVIPPNISDQFQETPVQSRQNFIIPSIILLLLFLFIGAIAYQSYEDRTNMKLKQEEIRADLVEQSGNMERLTHQMDIYNEENISIHLQIQQELDVINNSLEKQNKNLRSVRYWNWKQFEKLQELIEIKKSDSLE